MTDITRADREAREAMLDEAIAVVRAAREAMLDEAIAVVRAERLTDDTGTDDDAAYNRAIDDAIAALAALEGRT